MIDPWPDRWSGWGRRSRRIDLFLTDTPDGITLGFYVGMDLSSEEERAKIEVGRRAVVEWLDTENTCTHARTNNTNTHHQTRKQTQARAAKFGGHQEAWAKKLEDAEESKRKAERAQRFGLPGEAATAGLRKLGLNAERVRGCVSVYE